MFMHVVLMRYADDAPADLLPTIDAFVGRVRRECAGVLRYDHALNTASRARGFDHAIVALFDSAALHEAYQHSPVHQEMKAWMTPWIADLVVCDSELPPPSPAAPSTF